MCRTGRYLTEDKSRKRHACLTNHYRYMELNGFIGEEEINKLFFSHQITDQQYVKHHSQEMLDAYNSYLQDNALEDSEESAAR